MTLPSHLHPYQAKAVEWALAVRKGILADDIGLGKTVTSIAWADACLESPLSSVLVVCPKSLIEQWRAHVEQYSQFPDSYHYLNYEKLHKLQFLPSVTICDEATYIKSPTAIRSVRTVALASSCPRVLFLTATPVRNHEADMFCMFYCMEPFLQASHSGDFYTDLKRSYDDYISTYFDTYLLEANGRMVQRIGRMNPRGKMMLKQLLEKRVLRRTKSILSLPPFSREFVAVGMNRTQAQDYKELRDGILRTEDGETKNITNVLAKLTRLRQAALNPSLYGGSEASGKLEWLKDFFQIVHRPALVFTNYAEFAQQVHKALPGSVLLIGEMSQSMRQASIDAFMQGRSRIFILSATAGGFGLNLQKAEVVIWTDLPWTPDVWEQGTGRAYRQGQTNEVHEFVLGHPGTIDGNIVRLLQRKSKIAKEVDAMLEVFKELQTVKGGEGGK